MAVTYIVYHVLRVFVLVFILLDVCSASFSMAVTSSSTTDTVLIVVDQSGQGDYKTIQDAINAVASNNSELIYIWIKPGTYREKIVVPADKPFITLSGTEASNTIITWNDGGDIFNSPTLSVMASDFVARYLTIQNTFGMSGKAIALRVAGDRAALYGCRILSYQDTLLDDSGRHYYYNCYIEGATDFICGNAASLFESCHLHSLATTFGTITAQHRNSPFENTGFIFVGCKITGMGDGTVLGRPWGSCSRVIFAHTFMSNVISPEGWRGWDDPSKERSKRVGWSRELSHDESAPFLNKSMIGGRSWLRPTPTHFKKHLPRPIEDGGN
ncbi:Pectinesterase, catalytic [Cynara cardunculus var. scolymus]|uniref:pectinesterase n=1 Tax=Cynara cardunculus var. scolymus TaxID=59895 RepID=A0A118JUY1_CYNCS|nr:Pectinesterase, catalytic [Cynara cardunculus var. scolymus]